ncbi:MAG: hypothetical protein AAGF33_00560 [Pseudomonadota bacterium]
MTAESNVQTLVHKIDKALGLSAELAARIGSIIVYTGNIEYQLERAIWVIEGIDPRGTRPKTADKSITQLISILNDSSTEHVSDDAKNFLNVWAEAALAAYTFRNDIAHGVSIKMGETLVFNRNPTWNGELRKREPRDFWCEPYIIEKIHHSLAVLLWIISSIANETHQVDDLATGEINKSLNEARSILGEFAEPSYNPSFEKY